MAAPIARTALLALRPRRPAPLATVLLCLFAAVDCRGSDAGNPCPDLKVGNPNANNASGTSTQSESVVGQNVEYPCEDLICVADGGTAGYCSKKCLSERDCPEGFDCRKVMAIGEFSDTKFCTWKRCTSEKDCGNSKNKFTCVTYPSANPSPEYRLCSFAK